MAALALVRGPVPVGHQRARDQPASCRELTNRGDAVQAPDRSPEFTQSVVASPIGPLTLVAAGGARAGGAIGPQPRRPAPPAHARPGPPRQPRRPPPPR